MNNLKEKVIENKLNPLEFLERIESTTKDSITASKIREYLIKVQFWKTRKDISKNGTNNK